jgi:hypothetical protein
MSDEFSPILKEKLFASQGSNQDSQVRNISLQGLHVYLLEITPRSDLTE